MGHGWSFGTSTAAFHRWLHRADGELDLKCFKFPILAVWSAREAGDLDKAAAVAEELAPIIRRMNPKDNA